jgi:hypothetical protein
MVAISVLDAFEHMWLQFFHDSDLLFRKDKFDCLQRDKKPTRHSGQ